MKDEVLQKAISTDVQVIPRYDVVLPDGTKVAENVQLVLKNTILTEGTPLNKENLLGDDTCRAYGLDPQTSTPDDVFMAIRNSVGYCPRILVTATAGSTVYLATNDGSKSWTFDVPSIGQVVVDVPAFGTYKVWSVLNGVSSIKETIVIDTLKVYTLNVAYYVSYWKISVDAEVGATITVKHTDGSTLTGTVASDKSCTFTLPKTGKYTAVGIYDSCSSETYSLTVSDSDIGTTKTTSMKWITVTVNVTAGSIVAVTAGSDTRGGTATNGTIKVWLPRKDTWLITCTLNNKATTETVVVSAYQNYAVSLRYYFVYGVRIPLSSSSPASPEYTDDAVGMTSGYDGWATNSIIESIKPCILKDGVVQYYLNKTDLSKKVDGTASNLTSTSVGDVMVEIPKIGYRMYSDGTYQYIKITDQTNHPDYCYLAHSLSAEGDCDKIYIGAYLAMYSNNKIYSISGTDAHTSYTIANARTYAQNRGTGYQILSFYPWTLIQCLYTIIYKNLDSETSLGIGRIGNNNTAGKTGVANSLGPCYGTPLQAGNPLCFLNIEDPWGSLNCFLDGLYVDSSKKVYTAYKDFNDTGANYPYVTDLASVSGGFVKAIQGTNTSGFMPKEGNGSSTTYYCDTCSANTDCIATVGSGHSTSYDNRNYGIYTISAIYKAASTTSTLIGSRLVYKHKA